MAQPKCMGHGAPRIAIRPPTVSDVSKAMHMVCSLVAGRETQRLQVQEKSAWMLRSLLR